MVVERGDSTNIFWGWDEATDEFTVGTGSFTGATTGALTTTDGNIRAAVITASTNFAGALTGNVTGNTSGTAATVTTAAQAAITSLGTLTTLQVDNININGNAITSTAGTDLTITPLAGQQIVLDGAIVIDAGVVTGATSITSTAFVGDITGDVTGNTSGTAATVTTAAQTAITSVGTLTGLTMSGNVTLNAQTDLRFADSDSSNWVAFQSPATIGTNVTWTLPSADASVSGYALVSNSSGTLSWAAAGATTSSDTSTNTDFYIHFDSITSGAVTAVNHDTGLRYNPSTGSLTAAVFIGNMTGGSDTAATVTGAAQTAITSVGTLTALQVDNINIDGNAITSTAGTDLTITPLAGQQIVLDGAIVIDAGVVTGATSITSTAFVGDITGDVTGNADTATALETARTIGGTSFDGSANIAVALASVGTAVTVADESSDTTCFPLFTTAATGDLPPKSGTNLTFNSSSGLLTATLLAGDLTGNVTGTADVATVATTVTITDNESTDESNAIIFTAGGDVDGGNIGLESDGTLTYNPSTGKITATGFVGTLTGDVTGNTSGTAATVTGGTQAAITSAANLVTVGTITTGVWQGTTVAVNQGGTGVTSSTGTGNVVLSATPTFTGVPLSTTAAVGTNTTQIATTAFVLANAGGADDARRFAFYSAG